uniref:Transposase n=1 Tax=Geobacter metallireducens TaxID=28232 RepID=A0A831U358_GEOME
MSQLQPLTSEAVAAAFCADSLSWHHVGRWIIDRLNPGGPKCPKCGTGYNDETRLERWYQRERIRCTSCGHMHTSTSGTILANTTLEPRELFILLLTRERFTVAERAKMLGMNPKTVRTWDAKLTDGGCPNV